MSRIKIDTDTIILHIRTFKTGTSDGEGGGNNCSDEGDGQGLAYGDKGGEVGSFGEGSGYGAGHGVYRVGTVL